MKLVRKCGVIMTAVAASLLSCSVLASGGGGDTFKEGVNYIPIKPHLVVNYGGTGKVKYIKAELSLRTEDMHSAQEVSHHMPLVRDTLIMLISSVTDEQMASPEGKEKMRLEALEKINTVLDHAIHPASAKAAADDHAKDDHGKKEKPKADKDKKAKDDEEKEHDDKKAEHKGPLVSDLLFDNLVVQK
ncbi:MAG TPA: flagellar basal body-associated FliL family protein [Cellvibrio sp.]|nr:flagellar basal body-associated FliL family protein [Cellvibrio sp.]